MHEGASAEESMAGQGAATSAQARALETYGAGQGVASRGAAGGRVLDSASTVYSTPVAQEE
jgi:hypothetical protein